MGIQLRIAVYLTFTCLLTACNIEVTILGKGTVQAIYENAEPLDPTAGNCASDICFKVDSDATVELHPTPQPGYEFAGWQGGCEAIINCTLTGSRDRSLVAVFKSKSEIMPLMSYADRYFFSGPWPTDLKTKSDGTLDTNNFPFNGKLFESIVEREAGRSIGYAPNGAIYFPIASDIPHFPVFLTSGQPETSAIQVVNLNPQSPNYGTSHPIRVGLFRSDELEKDSLLHIHPLDGFELEAGSQYAAFMLTGSSHLPFDVVKSPQMESLSAGKGNSTLEQHWQTLKNHLVQHTAIDPQQVAAFTLFSIQGEHANVAKVREYLDSVDFDDELQHPIAIENHTPACTEWEINNNASKTFWINYSTPFFLKGKPPFVLNGGKLNLDENGKVKHRFHVQNKALLMVPCRTDIPAQGYPLEVYGMGTSTPLTDFQSLRTYSSGAIGSIKIFVSAPYTDDRDYGEEMGNLSVLEKLFRIDAQYIMGALGDMNPLNLGAVQTQYLQNAAELIFSYELATRLSDYLEDHPIPNLSSDETKIDKTNVTFGGFSLGALTSLQASKLRNVNKNQVLMVVPRPTASHANGLIAYLEQQFLTQSQLNVFGALLGVDYPFQLDDPIWTMLQQVIAPIDPVNSVDELKDKNVLLMMSSYYDGLHGGAASYELAAALYQQHGARPYYVSEFSRNAYPLVDYVRSPELDFGEIYENQPIKVITTFADGWDAYMTFTSQMTGTRFSADAQEDPLPYETNY